MEIYRYQVVSCDTLSKDARFGLRYRCEDDRLRESVRLHGVMLPITVTHHGQYVLSGHKRLAAAHGIGLREIGVLEINEDWDERDCFIYAIASNLNHIWTDIDRAMTLKKAVACFHMNEKEIIEGIFPLIGLPAGRKVFQEYYETAHLDKMLLDAIADEKMPFQGGYVLTKMGSANQQYFAKYVVENAALTVNELMKIGEWLSDMIEVESDENSLKSFVEAKGLNTILNQSNSERRQRGEKFYRAIQGLRFPRFVAYDETFKDVAHLICDKCDGLKVDAFPSYEETGYKISAHIKDRKSLENIMGQLQCKKSLLNSLFDIKL